MQGGNPTTPGVGKPPAITMKYDELPEYPDDLWPLIIEVEDGWLIEWWTGECPSEGQA